MKQLECKGDWWLPDKRDSKVGGTLRFTGSEGAALELMGNFEGIEESMVEGIKEPRLLSPDIILGISSGDEKITLHKCTLTQTKGKAAFFHASYVFMGAHFPKPEDIKFKSISVRYQYLDAWIGISGFHTEGLYAHPDPFKGLRVEYRRPNPILARMEEKTISLVFTLASSFSSHLRQEVKLRQKAHFHVEFDEEVSLENVISVIYRLQGFLSLAVGQPAYPIAIRGATEASKMMLGEGKSRFRPVHIMYQGFGVRVKGVPLMLFTFHDLLGNFETFVKSWFERMEMLEPVYDLYFGTLYDSAMYLEHQFLSLAQAVEAYHRKRIRNEDLPESEHKRRVSEIITATPGEHREWLMKRLEYSNEPRFRKRLEELFDQPALGHVLELEPDKSGFIQLILDTRNYLTHWDENLKDKSARSEQLLLLAQKLRVVLQTILLVELGFEADWVNAMIRKTPLFRSVYRG